MLKTAYIRGMCDARRKYAGTLGASVAVQPQGVEMSHGTNSIPYPLKTPLAASENVDEFAPPSNMPEWLWDNFTSYDQVAPGRTDGTFGSEVVG
jgi:hypothetical protein